MMLSYYLAMLALAFAVVLYVKAPRRFEPYVLAMLGLALIAYVSLGQCCSHSTTLSPKSRTAHHMSTGKGTAILRGLPRDEALSQRTRGTINQDGLARAIQDAGEVVRRNAEGARKAVRKRKEAASARKAVKRDAESAKRLVARSSENARRAVERDAAEARDAVSRAMGRHLGEAQGGTWCALQ
jgi:hypothetical protein